jgi:predicted DsbA family dithiol-disulfide isomerase
MAAEGGLIYNLDKAVVANSFKAHRFSHLAKKHCLGIEAEEQLFKAYFTDSKNIDDNEILIELGKEIGLDAAEIKQVLESDAYADDVKHDIDSAQQLGIQGVPFFVLNNKYAISGAQAIPVFEQTLEKAFGEWKQENHKPKLEVIEGESCGPDSNC